MTNHLSPQDCVNALDGVLKPAQQAHVDACADCHGQIETLRAVVEAAKREGDVPEPSPLFWDHFHARVMAASEAAAQEPAATGTRFGWMSPTWGLATGAALCAIIAGAAFLFGRPASPVTATVADRGGQELLSEGTDVPMGLDAGEWAFVTDLIGTLDSDDIHAVLAPSRDAVDGALAGLTNAERDAFVELLKAEMAEGTVQGS